MLRERSNADINPQVLGQRVLAARRASGLTQQQVCDAVGFSRPTYIAVEKGERTPSPAELVKLASLFRRSLNEMLRQTEPIEQFVSHFRTATAEGSVELDDAVQLLEKLVDNYLDLETKLKDPLTRRYPNVYSIEGLEIADAAEQVAESERNRLGLGDSPVPHLREILESDVGLRIFCIPLPGKVSGLFLFSERTGGCIALQSKHPAGRRRWSLAHEYAHFLVHRYEPEITVMRSYSKSSPKERFADCFAQAFLMPASGLRRRIQDVLRSSGKVTPASLITLADLYGVSFEALLLRSEGLGFIRVGTWERLRESGFRVQEAQALLGIDGRSKEADLPKRYVNLVARANEAGFLSEEEAATFLRLDRQAAREAVQNALRWNEVTLGGEAGQLELDLGEPLSASGSSGR